jgi:KDO2-lipid IV(A) lauroyltransferase
LGAFLGRIAFRLFPGERTKGRASLRVAFPDMPEKAMDDVLRRMFEHLTTCALELALIEKIDAQLETYVELPEPGRALFDEALAAGKGIVFVAGHVGNWELLARRFAMAGYDCATIAKESSDPRLTQLIERLRSSGKLRSIWRGAPGAAKAMLRQLKNNGVLGLLIDQDTRVQGLFVEFFGRKAFTPRAPADLAVRSEAAVVVGSIHRRALGGHTIDVRRISLPPGQGEAAVLDLTQRLTSAIEAAIRANPTEWVWMHQRWKTRPQGELLDAGPSLSTHGAPALPSAP